MEKRVPVVVIKELEKTDEILKALKAYGINTAEITFRTACAKEAIAYATKNFPDMNIGAGTVINAKQAKEAIACGAKFIVGPGLDEGVAKYCKKNNVKFINRSVYAFKTADKQIHRTRHRKTKNKSLFFEFFNSNHRLC